MDQQLPQILLLPRGHPDPRKAIFLQQLHQQLRVPLVVLLLPRIAGPNLRRIPDPHLMPQLGHQFQIPLTVPRSLHADPRTRRKPPVELLHCSRFVHQLLISHFSGLPADPRNLLPTGVKITSNKNHKAPSVPKASVLNQKLTRCALEPSLLSNQGSVSWYLGLGVDSSSDSPHVRPNRLASRAHVLTF